MAVSLKTTQQVRGTVQPVDRLGNAAPVQEGTVEYTSSNPDVFVVEEDPENETAFKVVAKGVGTGELRVTADADLGEGVETIETFAAVEVFPESAVGFGLQFGQPEDQPTGSSES